MTAQPAYFERIRQSAEKRWTQLELDPELAGPWHQLFKQVQSPRHILSELLQNADDAGATEATVLIRDGLFIFRHDGEDFSEEHFASLCRFGYSNKRALHTIGFRGIGFKSTFSLGDTVQVRTPTLAVAFDRRRFTQPRWLDACPNGDGLTEIRVEIKDDLRRREVEQNLNDWLKSPISLLFFKHIRRLRVGDRELHWRSVGVGPVASSEWFVLGTDENERFLVVQSAAEDFPADALEEIRQERLIDIEQDAAFPPCKVEIVLGASGRLYVVLPTGVETRLPFACNAPFIQDPARLKIKDPETSPTNRWLLERAGAIAASAMLQWLHTNGPTEQRCRAYGLFPRAQASDSSLPAECAKVVEESFVSALRDEPFLLCDDGGLKPPNECVAIPPQLFEVWSEETTGQLLDPGGRPALSRYVADRDCAGLKSRGCVEEIVKDDVLRILQTKHLPRPRTWKRLLNLWMYVAPDLTTFRYGVDRDAVCILPVQGKDVLYAVKEVVKLGEKKLLQSEADWQFLASRLLVLNQNWPRFLAETRREAEQHNDNALMRGVEAAFAVLHALGLDDATDVSKVVDRFAVEFFRASPISLQDCVQLAQICAKLSASVGDAFRFVTEDQHLRAPSGNILFDADGALKSLLPNDWSAQHLLHVDYFRNLRSCTAEEWRRWVVSGRARLQLFAPLTQSLQSVWGRANIEKEIRKRGYSGHIHYPYVTSQFRIEDWDFGEKLWSHWAVLAKEDPNLWGRVVEGVLSQPEGFWSGATGARALQVATTGRAQNMCYEALLPSWVLKLRMLPCLPDVHGFFHSPADLLRRTPETESLMDVEPFVNARLDTEDNRPLLKLLGVRDVPTGPARLLECLRALAKAERPPVHEVEKWYRRLDQMIETCPTADFLTIKRALHEEKLILTEGVDWVRATGVFLSSDEEDVPGAALIRSSVRDLTLWRKIDIAERPTFELAMEWLRSLPSSEILSPEDARRVRGLLSRHAAGVWNECKHWVNLAGEWAPVETLTYSLTMQSLIQWGHLHPWAKERAADLRGLSAEITEAHPFSDLVSLSACIEERFHRDPHSPTKSERKAWLSQLGADLMRVDLSDGAETERVRSLAFQLTETVWQTTAGLETIPYIDGKPAGTPRRVDVLWLNGVLFVEDRPSPRLARSVSHELGRSFQRQDIADAIKLCYDRPPEFVTEFLNENFKLAPPVPVGTQATPDDDSAASPQDTTQLEPTHDNQLADDAVIEPVSEEDSKRAEQTDDPESSDDVSDSDDKDAEPVDKPPKDRPRPKPDRPSVLERFALGQGFRKDGEDRYFHSDGSWIGKEVGARFPWVRRSSAGALIRYYLPRDHCLEREPLQIEADIWDLMERFPDTYSLVLSNLKGDPEELPGARMCALRAGGSLVLYPAAYRLVYEDEHMQRL